MKKINIVIGITGGIAAYKACGIVSYLKSEGANVDVIMTKNACEFITPLTLETLSKNKVIVDMFDEEDYSDEQYDRDFEEYQMYLDSLDDTVTASEDFGDYEDEIQEIDQEFTSENTSINSGKLPAIFNMVHFEPGTINIDYGGGKFDNVADYLTQYDVINLVYDPYNRSKEHNKEVLRTCKAAGGADTATCSNVLNVIKEPEVRKNVLENIKKIVKPTGTVYITVYEGSGKGRSQAHSRAHSVS